MAIEGYGGGTDKKREGRGNQEPGASSSGAPPPPQLDPSPGARTHQIDEGDGSEDDSEYEYGDGSAPSAQGGGGVGGSDGIAPSSNSGGSGGSHGSHPQQPRSRVRNSAEVVEFEIMAYAEGELVCGVVCVCVNPCMAGALI